MSARRILLTVHGEGIYYWRKKEATVVWVPADGGEPETFVCASSRPNTRSQALRAAVGYEVMRGARLEGPNWRRKRGLRDVEE